MDRFATVAQLKSAGPVKNVSSVGNAIAEVDPKAEIAGPQGVAHLPILAGVRFRRLDAVHRERARPHEPLWVAGARVELEEGVGSAVATRLQPFGSPGSAVIDPLLTWGGAGS